MASGPAPSRMRDSSETMSAIASSHEAARKLPSPVRMSGVCSRSRLRENPCAKRPFRHVWPLFAGPSSAGAIETTRPSTACASRRQPTPQ